MRENGSNHEEEFTLSRLAAIGEISAGIAHEIRNPLTSVKGFLQLMQREHPHQYLAMASSELERAILTVQNLLQVSKPDLIDESYQSISVCSELEYLLYLFQEQAYQVIVKTEFENQDTKIFGKLNVLKKVFFNLLKNAFEAIDGAGSITVKHWASGTYLHVSIRDTGVGISKQSLPLLGTPFFSTKDHGVGMGLTQVYSTVYEHGGRVNVVSQEGEGTTFTITLPLNQYNIPGGVKLNLQYVEGQTVVEYIMHNWEEFRKEYEQEMHSGLGELGVLPTNSINGMTFIRHLIEGNIHELITDGKQLGRNAAKENLPMPVILDVIRIFRRCLWDFIFQYHRNVVVDEKGVFELERKVNYSLDQFLLHFVSNYVDYKNDVLKSHREAIDELSVPIIRLTDKQAVLPLVGTIDTHRAKKIQEKTLDQIASLQIEHIIIDVSAVAFMDTAVVSHLFRIIDGIKLLGCSTTMTGIRPEIANTMVALGVSLSDRVGIKGTLQQALRGDI